MRDRNNGSVPGSLEDLEYALANPGAPSRCVTLSKSQDGRLQVEWEDHPRTFYIDRSDSRRVYPMLSIVGYGDGLIYSHIPSYGQSRNASFHMKSIVKASRSVSIHTIINEWNNLEWVHSYIYPSHCSHLLFLSSHQLYPFHLPLVLVSHSSPLLIFSITVTSGNSPISRSIRPYSQSPEHMDTGDHPMDDNVIYTPRQVYSYIVLHSLVPEYVSLPAHSIRIHTWFLGDHCVLWIEYAGWRVYQGSHDMCG